MVRATLLALGVGTAVCFTPGAAPLRVTTPAVAPVRGAAEVVMMVRRRKDPTLHVRAPLRPR